MDTEIGRRACVLELGSSLFLPSHHKTIAIFTHDIGESGIIHFIFSAIVILLNIFLFFVLYPKYVDEKYSKKLIIPLSIVLFIYSAVIAIIW